MLYEFKEQDAYEFVRHIGAKAQKRGDNLHFVMCPYCRSKTDKGTFAINLKTGQFKCLRNSCGITGNMITLSKDFDFSLGTDIDEYYKPKKKYKTLKTPEKKIEPKPPAIEYLASRNISEDIAKKYEITVQNEHENILVFPFFDDKGKLQFVKYRKTDFDKGKDKNKEWCEANTRPILFGMKQCSQQFEKLVVTEGQMDSLAVATAFNGNVDVVSVPTGAKGFTWIPYCWDWINKFQEFVIFGDFEKGHISLLDELSKRLNGAIKHVRHEDYKDCKDANELLIKYGAEHVKKCVENATIIPMERIVKLSEVQTKNIYELPKLKTGVALLDRFLYGGLPFGMVTLLGGKRGDGKSTFLSQIGSNAIQQGFSVLAYSGELPNYLYKSWIDFQIAGRRNIVEQKNDSTGGINRFITNSTQELINNWYDDKFYLYDNSYIGEDDEQESLLQLVENAVKQYGIKVVMIDNLMTAMYLDTDNTPQYEKQGKFVRSLTKLALRYDLCVILVAHRRKNNFTADANDEISGSADITNLAGITLSYDRGNKEDFDMGTMAMSDRKLIIAKNRLFGKTNTEGIILHYDERSKRIYGQADNVDSPYSWEENKPFNGFQISMEDNPFN